MTFNDFNVYCEWINGSMIEMDNKAIFIFCAACLERCWKSVYVHSKKYDLTDRIYNYRIVLNLIWEDLEEKTDFEIPSEFYIQVDGGYFIPEDSVWFERRKGKIEFHRIENDSDVTFSLNDEYVVDSVSRCIWRILCIFNKFAFEYCRFNWTLGNYVSIEIIELLRINDSLDENSFFKELVQSEIKEQVALIENIRNQESFNADFVKEIFSTSKEKDTFSDFAFLNCQ